MRFTLTRLLGALALTMALAGSASAVPVAVPYTGQLTDGGAPVNGTLGTVVVRLYTAPDGPASTYWTSDPYTNVPVSNGTFTLVLATGNPIPLDSAILAQENLWAELWVNGNAVPPRQKLMPVPAAKRATDAAALGGLPASEYIQEGANAILGGLQVTGNLIAGGAVRIGTTADACSSGGEGTLRYWMGSLSLCDGGSWVPLLSTGNAIVDWSMITGLPAGFADDVDNTSPQYYAGTGLYLTGTTFHVNADTMQRRVPTDCGASAINAVASDGTATCIPVGQTYTAHPLGGLELSGTTFSMLSTCTSGQVLKFDGSAWACEPDKVSNAFSQLTGTASDAQVPDDITVNWSRDADMVDGHHYSPVWDSTDAETLGGFPPSWFATSSQADLVDSKIENLKNATPNQAQALCGSYYQDTKVCKRDVWMADTHMRDDDSLMMLSGGSWVYYEEANRCEYMGGKETPNAKECGLDLMPSWIDTSDECGGFRQSEWDARVWFAVSKSNQWNPEYQYTCPSGFRPMTTNEGKEIFMGPQGNTGPRVYSTQCGWKGRIWDGKDHYYFRFSDSKANYWSHKYSDDAEGNGVRYNASTFGQFAGIICISEDAPGPTDWMLTTDLCGGFRQSTYDPRFRFAVSRKNMYEDKVNYQCPEGYHWATTDEAYAVFNKETGSLESNSNRVYQNQCGWNSYDLGNNGLTRHTFRFADSFEGASTLATMHAGYGEEFTVQFDVPREPVSHVVNPSYFAGIVCKADEDPTPDDLDWMDTTDHCGGWRQDSWDPRFYFAVSKSWVWQPNKEYACPVGYKWATKAEWQAAHPGTTTSINDQRVYYNQCGWNGYVWNGASRNYWRFADSGTVGGQTATNWYLDGNWPENYIGSSTGATSNFAGIVCVKIGQGTYPTEGTLDWMQTDDDCKGFKPLGWNPKIRLAVSRQNNWNKTFAYSCPSGYHWANSTEAEALMQGAAISSSSWPWYKYRNQCGWDGSNQWQGRLRVYFRFADSAVNNRYFHAADYDQSSWSTDSTIGNFAGIVCIANDMSEGPLDWWDRSDNCGGFRQSPWDPRVRYMVARQNVWNPNRVYQCPAGYHWMSTAEYDASFEADSGGPSGGWDGHLNSTSYVHDYKYYSECGWTEYTWRNYYRVYFRLSDSNLNGRYAHAGHLDPHRTTNVDTSLTGFAGIVCMQNADTYDQTWWMDKTDNCGGWRQSTQHEDIYYAIAKSDMWDFDRDYVCPAGFYWATVNQYETVRQQKPQVAVSGSASRIYNNVCGWSGDSWNPSWRLGCNSYGNAGCGTNFLDPMPSAWEYRMDQALAPEQRSFEFGCDECEDYHPSSACNSYTTESGPDGKCYGINEGHWRNGQQVADCYFSANQYGGSPEGILPGSSSDHCRTINGQTVCCSDGVFQNSTYGRGTFRFRDSGGVPGAGPQNASSGGYDNYYHVLYGSYYDGQQHYTGSNSDTQRIPGNGWYWGHILNSFSGIVCIRNTNMPAP